MYHLRGGNKYYVSTVTKVIISNVTIVTTSLRRAVQTLANVEQNRFLRSIHCLSLPVKAESLKSDSAFSFEIGGCNSFLIA